MNTEEKIYTVFLKEPRPYYNQIKEITGLSHSSLQNMLKKMIDKGILDQEKTKSNIFYTIKDKKTASLKFAEIAVKRFHNLSTSVLVPLKNFLKDVPACIYTIVIFGSVSRGEEKKGSDIDLLVVSDKKIDLDQNKKKAEITSRYPLSLFYATSKQFLEPKDDVIFQARKTGFPIYKEQNFYEGVLDEYR